MKEDFEKMKPELVRAIFTNILFIIGVILTIFGFGRGSVTAAKFIVFGTYPLNGYEETRCDIQTSPMREGDTQTAEERRDARMSCFEAVERERKLQMIEDVVGSITMFTSGVVLIFSFKRFLFKKK